MSDIRQVSLNTVTKRSVNKDSIVTYQIIFSRGGITNMDTISIIQENSKVIEFIVTSDDQEDLIKFDVSFEVYEKLSTGNSVKRFMKSSSIATDVRIQGNKITVYLKPSDTRTFDLQSSYVYLLELESSDDTEKYTLERGLFEVVPRVIEP